MKTFGFGAMAAVLADRSTALTNRIFGAENIDRYLRQQKRDHAARGRTSIATANRWTGKPHEHRRQAARLQRQSIMHGASNG